jgi:HSP20 family molecular chaperone IbpA
MNTTRINPTTESNTATSDCGCGPSCCTTSETANTATTTYRPAADIAETDAAFTVRLDIPGANPDTIDVRVSGNELAISAKVPERTPKSPGATPLHREYGVGDFARSFRLGQEIDTANINATYEHGVLTLTLPKSDRVRARKIDVRVN